MDQNTPKQVELIFNATKLQGGTSQQDPYLKIFFIDNENTYKELGETEFQKRDPNPKWVKSFKMDFIFQRRQNLRFEVWDKNTISSDKLIGTAEATLSQIMADQTNNLKLSLTDQKNNHVGDLFCRAGNVGTNCVQWTWEGIKLKNMDTFSKSDPLMRLWYKGDNETYVYIKETEVIMDNNDPKWKRFETSLNLLCKNDLNRQFYIEVKDWEQSGNYKFIGEAYVSLAWIIQNPNALIELKDKGKINGHLKCSDVKLVKPEFIDFLMGGQQINIISAIDYTASNGEYTDPNSLHCADLSRNQYLTTLKAVCDVLLDFDQDKKISMYGFGGVPEFPNFKKYDTDHCFPVTGNPNNAEVGGVDGIVQTYLDSLKYVTLCGPTLFSEIIQKSMEYAKKQQDNNVYTILLILTDGVIDDLQESKILLSQAGELPFSVVIVGIGNDKFTSMKELDGPDVKEMTDVQYKRDCCNFIRFADYKKDSKKLLEQILAEIPQQLTTYKKQHKQFVR
ncbi:hypothetical protein IMG5_144620 [Ichthyophthirius multifiliis]|uniref:C2 domain-containing protein n=1 Tax=Ichthyophthirius multifiliis TaxID=5932 RepID=G0QXQ1_ICHMU|nr:hypothetical protein IMG5_144620 [Ichthyophthirius multifiliis]EGR29988.1 hypothetical protein IMG5_144620 [Ichthyophthirius multifiliis]|eukprot:XP_004031224.1 hypothetical protein IMG5_144620 [Ichthyophthirius multifiliis]